jgi:endonuclease/exonuclease/phosphatase (EEP) superfamily protein YafD
MLRLAALTVLAGVTVLVSVLAVFPSGAVTRWLSVQPGLAQVVAFPVPLAVVTALLAVGVLAWTYRTRRQRLGRTGLGMAMVLAVGAGVLLGGLFPPRPQVPVSAGSRPVTVVTWNTADRLRDEDLVRLYADAAPDVLVLPETRPGPVEDIIEHQSGLPALQVFSSRSLRAGIAPTTVLVSRDLGEYRALPPGIVPEFSLGAVGLEPVSDPTLPLVWGLHPPPPIPGLMDDWRRELQLSTTLAGCHQAGGGAGPASRGSQEATHRGVIAAGDFNATLRHGSLAHRPHCADAMGAVGSRTAGTWPSSWPSWLGSPIDHVLVSGPLTPVSAEAFPIGTSDHRAVSTVIRVD